MEIDKIEGGDFKYSNTFMKILAQKYQKKTFLVPNLDNIVFIEILLLDKSDGCDFKYDNSFSNSYPKIPNQGIFGSKFRERQQLGFVTLNGNLFGH